MSKTSTNSTPVSACFKYPIIQYRHQSVEGLPNFEDGCPLLKRWVYPEITNHIVVMNARHNVIVRADCTWNYCCNMHILNSLCLFILAGICEIGGGYLVWLWVRQGKSGWQALGGAILLTAYGFVATLQPTNFGRAYAAYGSIFIILSIMWGWKVDNIMPDRLDWLGAAIVLGGVLVMMYAPRT